MLEVERLSVHFGGLRALDAVSFEVNAGEIVGLIGPNGAGKTTVFNAISRFVAPAGGAVRFRGQDVLRLRPHRLVRLGIARTFQNLGLFPYLTVSDNLLLGQHARFRSSTWAQLVRGRGARREEGALRAEALALLERVGFLAVKDAPVAGLPYGVRKFIEVCRALVARPQLVLLDEPAAGLTGGETEEMRHLILRARDEFGSTVLLIEHDMGLVMRTCDRVVALDFGQVIAQGPPERIQRHPDVIEAYLGTVEDKDA